MQNFYYSMAISDDFPPIMVRLTQSYTFKHSLNFISLHHLVTRTYNLKLNYLAINDDYYLLKPVLSKLFERLIQPSFISHKNVRKCMCNLRIKSSMADKQARQAKGHFSSPFFRHKLIDWVRSRFTWFKFSSVSEQCAKWYTLIVLYYMRLTIESKMEMWKNLHFDVTVQFHRI